jgi:putative ABC transport system permease protein
VLNETAARQLGFSSPSAALGKTVIWPRRIVKFGTNGGDWTEVAGGSEVIGVAPDFSIDMRAPVHPQLIYVEPHRVDMLSVRLAGQEIPETLAAIDKAWSDTGHRMIHRRFLDQSLQEIYAGVILQSTTIGLGAGLALVIAALGLFGLSAHAAEARTKEIGVRKAMGAGTADIVRLLLWQFSQPVLWANLIAWPAAWWAMNRWLSGFAYHVELPLWLFLAAGGAALVIACTTVLTHALLVARAAPATALRYE